MSINKRPLSSDGNNISTTNNKRYKRYNNQDVYKFESQDIGENIERLRIKRANSELTIKNSILFMTFPQNNSLQKCIEFSHKYISTTKLITNNLNFANLTCIILKDFNLLDVTMFLTIFCSLNDKYWLQADKNFTLKISKDIRLNGNIFFPKNCLKPNRSKRSNNFYNMNIQESYIDKLVKFKEFNISLSYNKSLSYFVMGIADFISSFKFSKYSNDTIRQFQIETKGYYKNLSLNLLNLPIPPTSLMDCNLLKETNSPIIENSNKVLLDFMKDPKSTKEVQPVKSVENFSKVEEARKVTQMINTNNVIKKAHEKWNNKPTNRNDDINVSHQKFNPPIQNNSNNNIHKTGYLTPIEIKQHCIATINTTIDFVRSKKSGDILKTYIRCPKQNCIDKIFQNLDQLRTQTNCNIVVLNLNNIHESDPWFKNLDLSKYTKVSIPPASTIRVISIGGMNEYIVKALNLITNIINSS